MAELKSKWKRKPLGYNKRTEEQREYDILFCSRLFLQGLSYRVITEKINEDLKNRNAGYTLSLSIIYYDLRQALIEWKRERLDTMDEYVTAECKKLDLMESELWESWVMSKTGKRKTKTRNSKSPKKVLNAEDVEQFYYGYNEDVIETSCGNPRFMELILKINIRRAELIGYNAPVKIDIPGLTKHDGISDERPQYNANSIPPELLYKLADSLQDSKQAQLIADKGKAN